MDKFLEKGGFAVNGQRTPKFFEEWARTHCMRPVCIVRDPDGDILLADSIDPIRSLGIYRVGYAIHRSGLEFGNFNDYPMNEFLFLSREAGTQQRINEALEHARATQRQLKAAGFYDAERKGRFSLRPN